MPASGAGCRSRLRSIQIAVVLFSTAILVGCDLPRFGAPDPASKEGDEVLTLWSGFFVTAGLVTLLIWVLLGWVLIRYRRRGRDDIPSQRAYHIPIEVVYTIIPVVMVIVLFTVSWRAESRITDVASDPAVRVRVVGFQWGWRFEYGEGFAIESAPGEDPVLVLPEGRPTNLHLVSVDVAHSFWVPDFLNKRDLIPGVNNTITVRPTRLGTYPGRCAEFCGLDHWRMQFKVRVVTPAEYATWSAAQTKEAKGN
ncbi:MAG: cytochrome c oxidase subunit II [Acidimicrobiales bacterium]|nr:cytochrome c oxidase subunit II [Acidimicrobiales bacterium]